MIDIDYFKRFNDEYGHDAGDLVMQYVGQTILDIVGDNGISCRNGGEEFTVLLPRQSEDEGEALAETLRRAISSVKLAHAGRTLGSVTVSLGIASSPHGGSIETLVSRADAALLYAKVRGRNRTVAVGKIDMRIGASDA
ncbi:hypothetical protein ASG42_27030 [Rhizobium sp. Leaf391]|nr:hypothetical protein ASG42_27030 [Rhizobium sp. Leaf391]